MRRILVISLGFPVVAYAQGDGRFSEMLIMVRNIEGGLHEEFLLTGEPLPSSLYEIELLRDINQRKPESGMLLNEMAVVPNAPEINEAPGIRRQHFKWRIFAIGRTPNTDHESYKGADGENMLGRYSVWISPDGKYCSPGWNPETEVQAVFKQIGGFDPSAQPVAFPEAEKRLLEKNSRKKRIRKEAESAYREHVARKLKDRFLPKKNNGEELPHRISWLLFIIIGLVLLVGPAFIVGKFKTASRLRR